MTEIIHFLDSQEDYFAGFETGRMHDIWFFSDDKTKYKNCLGQIIIPYGQNAFAWEFKSENEVIQNIEETPTWFQQIYNNIRTKQTSSI